MLVSGVRNSCETVETNSSFMRSSARRSVVSEKASTIPVGLLSLTMGQATYSTGKLVPSFFWNESVATRTVLSACNRRQNRRAAVRVRPCRQPAWASGEIEDVVAEESPVVNL